LSLGLISVLLIAGLVLAQSSLWLFDRSLRGYLQTTLQDEAQALLGAFERGPAGVQLDERRLSAAYKRPYSGLYFRIDFADQTWRSRSLWDRDLPRAQHLGLQTASTSRFRSPVITPPYSIAFAKYRKWAWVWDWLHW
jgi:hypothetical protein